MARDFSKNASNYMLLGLSPLGAQMQFFNKFSMHAWINIDTLDTAAITNNRIVSIAVGENATGLLLCIDNTTASKVVRIGGRSIDTDTFQSAPGLVDIPLSTWVSVGGVWDFEGGSSTLLPYTNGVADNGPAGVPFTFSYFDPGTSPPMTTQDAIGNSVMASGGTPVTASQLDGRIAEVALWRTDIGPQNFALLARGESALRVRATSLLLHIPLAGSASPEPDLVSRVSGTITGSIPGAAHPPLLQHGYQNWRDQRRRFPA